ncbi:amino acid adenylation domain-containing protein [Chitinophaga dinghuensis]|uniref:Amino acid adenylation domain-containing protein n=1 Tax=Chitinophaga dinghuensis TaxID=1539050 RepID=A0A327VU85_9BACT|nr:non-ribosomal peptide synthetase [Chitinophaga dinghuensis]RAJ77620.1 amino acid adenylation domain-containing protein [Chitinophaga dinghuensis]
MNALQLITALKKNKVVPRLQGDQLKLVGEVKNLSAELMEEIKSAKADLIALLKSSVEQFAAPIPVTARQQHYPLSNAQNRMWALHHLGGSTVYNIATSFYLTGDVSVITLGNAFRQSVARHESLRTFFREVNGEPRQFIAEDMPLSIGIKDIRGEENIRTCLEEILEQAIGWEFDLRNGPLMRVELLRVGDKEYVMVFAMHHIISDGWSIGVIVQEVFAAYEANRSNKLYQPEPLTIQYKDYAAWMSERMTGTKMERAVEFWRNEFRETVTPLNMPADFSRPDIKTTAGAVSKFYITPALHQRIQDYCNLHHITLFNYLRTICNILLYKYANNRDVVIGTPVSGRNHYQLEQQVGLYVNTVPLRTRIDETLSFRDFLQQVAEHSYRAFEFQDCPFDSIVEMLELKRDISRNPLFDVMIVLQNTAQTYSGTNQQQDFTLSGLDSYLYRDGRPEDEKRPAKLDLTFNFDHDPDGRFFLEIEYAVKLFKKESIARIFQAFAHINMQVLDTPDIYLGNISIADAQDIHQVLHVFNQPILPVTEKSISHLLENSFGKYVDHIALIAGDRTFTYGQLNELAETIAAALPPKPQHRSFAGILMQRTSYMPASILGILRAGYAYLPIDTKYPASRINFLLEDASPDIILTDAVSAALIPANYTGTILYVDALETVASERKAQPLPADSLQEETAYLIYTSGSTGKPKGVEICHRNTIAFLQWAATEFAATPYNILYAATSCCFDLSVFELFFPLLQGKTIRLLEAATEIPKFIQQDKGIMLNTVPSVVRSLLDMKMDWQHVTALNMAGEAAPRRLKDELDYRRMEVRNLYGPSEDTTYSTIYHFMEDEHSAVPIGTPIAYTQLYILDSHLNLLPVGVDGEIYLTGEGVAKGYCNRAELTAERFVDNPFLAGRKMYKTGDIGCWLSDGNVAFRGRIDDQVKVRGYRIEPGEIQYVLEQHPMVQQAYVTVMLVADEYKIVSYIVGDASLLAEHLKSFVGERMPAYMIPAYCIMLQDIPLNNNGKVAREQLPAPEMSVGALQEPTVPQSPLETQLLSIWKEVLRTDNIGTTHNFFESGGQSLKAMMLRSMVANNLSKQITLQEIFALPTIVQQAALLQDRPAVITAFIERADTATDYPISLAQERLWVLTGFEEASRAYHMPAAFHIKGQLDETLLEKAFHLVIHKYEILRTVFAERNGLPVQLVQAPEEVSFKVEQIIVNEYLSEEELTTLLQKKWSATFDLQKGPLLQCFLLRAPSGDILSFNMHHIISDGWSLVVLCNQVLQAYRQLAAGNTRELMPPMLQFKDYAVWQREQLNAGHMEADLLYWKNIFTGEIPSLVLPYDFHRPDVKTYQGAEYTAHFGAPFTQRIKQLAADSGVSLFMLLMTAVKVLIKKYAGQDDIIIGTPVAGRNSEQLHDQIGFFVNTLAIRSSIPSAASFVEVMQQEKEVMLQAFEHQHFPFEWLLEQLDLKRDLSRSPLFDVMLVLQNIDGMESTVTAQVTEDLHLERMAVQTGIAKYDLLFAFSEVGEEISLALEYNTALFRESTIIRVVKHLVRLLEQVTAQPEMAIRDIGLPDSEELHLMTLKADQTWVPYNATATINSLFRETVSRYPDNIALICGDTHLTYRQLDDASGRLAHKLLHDYRVMEEELIVLHTGRTEWMVIAILAVLKAGAAYVPVDPAYPLTRKDYIIRDSRARWILTDSPVDNTLKELFTDSHFIDITALNDDTATSEVTVSPSGLAYVIYTSGTTGNPKGVLVEHRNVTRLLFNDNNLFDFGPNDKWSLFHSYCFDFSVWEMYGALLNGGTLVMVPAATAQDSIAFFDFLLQEKITVLNQTPTAFRSLLLHNQDRLSDAPLRYLIFGGEALMPAILDAWSLSSPACRNINMYGITETTVHVTYKEISRREIEENRSNVGIPIPTLSCYILDNDMQRVPIGVIGELCVGGAGVARGYLHQPELTAQKFIDNPFLPGEKLYRSGDYARIMDNGDIEYIGRRDDQVKIRGHRIEIAEIEAAFMALPAVKDAVVIVWKNNAAEAELAAYYIPAEDVTVSALRKALLATLPGYMVPAHIIPLEDFPLNANGKLDKTALHRPESRVQAMHTGYEGPRHETDEKIIAIWEAILERTHIGIKDNFFDLGGHSLKATRVISRVQESFGIKIDMKTLFIDPTVEHLSDYIETMKWMEDDNEVIAGSEDEIIF